MNKRRVLVIYTGGTIGMKRTDKGYSPLQEFLSEELGTIRDLFRQDFPSWELIELNPLLDSSDIAVEEWNRVAELVFNNYQSYDGFVILHGTDTMAYTASALSFMLEGLNKPVVLTGSQIPLTEIRSDGRDNLIGSILIAADGVVRAVSLFFGGKLFRGNRSTKVSTDELLGFASPNYPSLASVGTAIKYNLPAIHNCNREEEREKKLCLRRLSNVPIGVLKIFPGIQYGLFETLMTEKLSGIVLESFGAGNVPKNSGELLPIITRAFLHGAVVAVCSQCPSGVVSLGAYETGFALKKAGAVSGVDMTTEAAVTKLYYLFSIGLTVEEIKKKMEISLRGELTENGRSLFSEPILNK